MNTQTQNALVLKPNQLSMLLSKSIAAKLPIMITGAPGIGKTDIVHAASNAANADCIVMHPVVSDPTDFKGMPWVKDGVAEFLPFGDLNRLMHADKLTLCFMDDVGQASNAVQAALMQLVLARQINGQKISDQVVFVTATNRRTDRAGVSGILEPLKSRFVTIVELVPDLKDWITWALSPEANIVPQIIAYLRLRPEHLSDFRPTSDLVNSPSPRTWSHLSKLISLDLPQTMRLQAYAGAIGEPTAVEFASFERVWQSMVSPDVVLSNPKAAPIPSEPSALYALATALAMRVTKDSMQRYVTYIDRLIGDNKAEFAAVSMQTAITRDQNLANTGAYIQAMAGSLGKLMIGE